MENNESEEWRSIDGYEGYYQVSSLGRVKSLSRLANFNGGIGLRKGKILKPGVVTDGYLQVILCKDGKRTKFLVHRLVGMAFQDICGQYMEVLEIDHRNTNRTDNRAVNLHWVTRKENQNNPLTRQCKSNLRKGEKHPMWGKFGKSNPNSVPIIQMDRQGNFLAEFDGLHDAARKLNIYQGNISSALNGRYKTAGGYIWKYKNPTPQNKAI